MSELRFHADRPEGAGATRSWIDELAREQAALYRDHPLEMRPAYTHEQSVEQAYRGRQLLELMQNADDAGRDYGGTARLLFRLDGGFFIAANAGTPFSDDGIASLVIADRSPKQLARGGYIGQKGLGFRSLLSWSMCPLVSSGDHLIAFSPDHAATEALAIARAVPRLQEEIDQFVAEFGVIPVPVMRFPYVPGRDDARVRIAAALRDDGFDTVVVLPLPDGERGIAVREEIIRQAREVDAAALLFANSLSEVCLDVADETTTWHVEREHTAEVDRVVLQHADNIAFWTVYRRELLAPASAAGELAHYAQIALAVAVPERIEARPRNTLCVYFPTSVSLPMGMLAHATLETDASRKRLIASATTQYALEELATLVAEVAASEASSGCDPWRGLALLAGIEHCDPELVNLGFRDAVFTAIRRQSLFPRVDGTLASASHVWLPPAPCWSAISAPDWLGDLLAGAASPGTDSLVAAVGLEALPTIEQARRLEERASVALVEARGSALGELVGTLLMAGALPRAPVASVLLSDSGALLSAADPALLPPEGPAVRCPPWAEGIHFLAPEFAEGLRASTRVTARELGRRLAQAGYRVEEYQLETVARRLVAAADRAPDSVALRERHCEVIQRVFEMTGAPEAGGPIDVPFRVLTEGGSVRPARECYVGQSYPAGRLLHALYGPQGRDEFCAGPSALGLNADAGTIQRFLGRIGVATSVRDVKLNSLGAMAAAGLSEHVRDTLEHLQYPRQLAGQVFTSANDAARALAVHYDAASHVPDRWREVLSTAQPEPIIAYLAQNALARLGTGSSTSVSLFARHGSQLNFRDVGPVPATDPLLFLLREIPWVPGDDGKRHCPRQIALSATVQRALGAAFRTAVLDTASPFLREVGGVETARLILRTAGAVMSLDTVQGDELYTLLLELPKRDPDGKIAPSIYRSLLETPDRDTESFRRDEFVQRGQMWGRRGAEVGYFDVSALRYAPHMAVPDPIRAHVALVDVDARRSAGSVERIFGVRPLRSEEYDVTVATATPASFSPAAARHLTECIPYLYALRLFQSADARGAERRAFGDMTLIVCREIVATVSFAERDSERVVLEDDLRGLTVGRSLYIVSRADSVSSDPVFWRAVADLVAGVLDVARVSGDLASLLACVDGLQRARLLDRMTDGQGTEFLAAARAALQFADPGSDELTFASSRFERPVSSVEPATPHPPTAADATSASPAAAPTGTPVPIAAPETRVAGPRSLVVASQVPAHSGGGASSVNGEDETLAVAERFEEAADPPRYPLRVSHLRGTDAFGCDIISFPTAEARNSAQRLGTVDLRDVARFIEVKGRTNRTAPVELTPNERAAAIRFRGRYFIYRVYTEVAGAKQYELAVLCDPTQSPGQHETVSYSYSLAAGSGAAWYRLSSAAPHQVQAVPAAEPNEADHPSDANGAPPGETTPS